MITNAERMPINAKMARERIEHLNNNSNRLAENENVEFDKTLHGTVYFDANPKRSKKIGGNANPVWL